MIRYINLGKTILLLFLFWASDSLSADLAQKSSIAGKTVHKFIRSGDTSGLYRSLAFLNDHFEAKTHKPLLQPLLKISQQETRLDKNALKTLYFLIRKFYEADANKIKYFEYSLKISKILGQTSDYEGQMWVNIDIGNIFFSEQDYDHAKVYYRKAGRAARKADSNFGLSIIYLNYGMIGERKKNYRESFENYKISSVYRLKSGNVKVVSSTYIKMALACLNLNQPDSCMHYIRLTEDYYYHKGEPSELLRDMPFNINYVYAEYYFRQQKLSQALRHIQKAEQYCIDNQLTGELIASNAFYAGYLYKAQKYREAISKISEQLPLLQQHGLLDQQKYAYRMLKNCWSALKEYEKSNAAAQQYVLIDDSISKRHVWSELNMIRSIAAVYGSESRLSHMRKNLQIEQIQTNIRNAQRNTSVLIAIFPTIAIFVLGGLILNSRRNRSKLVSMHTQLVQKNSEIKLNALALQRSNQLKDNLFSIIANDLRNPLYQLLEELNVLQQSLTEKQLTTQIENTLKETITLFEGLLEWSKTNHKQHIFSPVRVNLDENINKIILFYLPEIQAQEIKIINKSVAISTFADQNIVQTVLRNLLGNSIAAVAKRGINGMIEIETQLLGENYIEIVISDSGPGFPQEILQKFNEAQFDVNAKSQGLGLSICKALSRISGWKMELSNGGTLNGAKTRIVVPLFREDAVMQPANMQRQMSVDARHALVPLKSLRFFQTSEIRLFMKNITQTEDPELKEWMKLLEKSVHEGDRKMYEELIDEL